MEEKKKFSAKHKKAAIICVLVLMIAGVGYANYAINNSAEKQTSDMTVLSASDEQTVDVFSTYRDERKTARAQEISYIDSVVSSGETDASTKTQAQEQKLALVTNMEHELTIEGLITTKLNTDAVVTVKDGAVNVVIDKKTLSDDEVSQIAEIVKTQTGQSAKNIKIMPQG